jgi:hypothetical protein
MINGAKPPIFNKDEVLRRSFQFFNGQENRFTFSWKRYSISATPIEVGGVTSNRFRLRNPTNNLVAVLEKLFVGSSANDTIFFSLGISTGDLPTVLTGQRLDSRQLSTPSGITPSSDTSGGPSSPQTGLVSVLANSGVDVILTTDQELVLLPGDTFDIYQSVVGVGTVLKVWAFWRERLLEEVEKSANYGKFL